ncbi:MAG: bifunctional serine/threonine-protein kinase/formylglycine-generating enzyme family protein [Nostocaceae cyanobacterium]|nr:bifunctional serine/threonine-protein kinase/formylglycine-generating enzyme family protein [Nostocaceae cyanobacterium]
MLIGANLRNRYHIIRLLGSGGFGDTYLAEDLDLPDKPSCVVKHLKSQKIDPTVLPIAKRLFENEAQVLYRLGNESNQIPGLFAHFEENGEFYLVQEFIAGTDLSSEIKAGKKLSEQEVNQLLQEILTVLAVVHKQNIIHRDIKPQNIMRRHSDGKIILIDFGAVKEKMTMNGQGQSSVTVATGTPGYMPSEQGIGQPKLSSDVYAVGMLGIFALTGIEPCDLPRDPMTTEVIWRNWANVSDKLADILTKMTRYHFSQRYHSAVEALEALKGSQLSPTIAIPTIPILTTILTPTPTAATTAAATTTPTPTPTRNNWTRRKVIQRVGLVAGSLITVIVAKDIWQFFSKGNPQTQKAKKPGLSSFSFKSVTVDARGIITKGRNQEVQYFVEDLGNGVILEMVRIPGGTFIMGSPPEEEGRQDDEGPQHKVTVTEFFMTKYEVTQAQYQAIMGENPSYFKEEKRPVERISWNDADLFCKKLSQKTGRSYRLPSEAEWEYAARAGTTTPFYFGETITTELANYRGTDWNYQGILHPGNYGRGPKGIFREETIEIGRFQPNSFGLYDMHGNVWEWCQDTWHNNYNGAPEDGSAWIDNDNRYRVLRGGSWISDCQYCRCANRYSFYPSVIHTDVGFRVCAVK